MAYVFPRQCIHPIGRITHLRVLHDGGEGYGTPFSGWSLAICAWDGAPDVYLFRWNTNDSTPRGHVHLGFPLLQGGLPGWVVLPSPAGIAMHQSVINMEAAI